MPGTKHQPEARVETLIAGIDFRCPYGPNDYAPSYAYRFEKPISYRFIEEERQKPSNWLPPIFKQVRRGKIETHFVRLEYTDDSKTTTKLVFYYVTGLLDDQREDQFARYVQGTAAHLLEQSGLSEESGLPVPISLQVITSPETVAQLA